MKYNQEDIIRLIDLSFKNYAANQDFRREFPLDASSDTEQLQSLLKKPDVLQALLIVYNGPEFCNSHSGSHTAPLLLTADQYPLSYLNLSSRTANALSRLPQLITVGDLFRIPDAEITRIRGIGPHSKTMEEIRAARMKFIGEFQDGLIR